ncbi:exopolyphosphatase [Niveibacterium umoris]|uniref:Exopolyphosphatase n=1 Tax=Niveibacterium umoris TaxID=1193620 RepID=A0A840BIM9_9RHOO|nr:exopolyphosphatase [Niveibacterium umoris]MBB4011449.1 exopolyphosphatase/guanosine-5'-triphosphate,3'-diphosphate pyrophosphatase [Niveibacterium umoris]
MKHELIAAVDLGSNSFRLIVGRVVGDQIFALDNLKEPVRLAGGLTPDKQLDIASQARGLSALRKFGERLRGFRADEVRAVATNTLRVAKNAGSFLEQAEQALGFPIEVISGREEARLIYLGVVHTLPDPGHKQLVFDIGGGSTEFIIGRGLEPIVLESLYMGCVSYSLKFFPEGRIDKAGLRAAEIAAMRELETIAHTYREVGWELAIASSGSAKAIAELLELNHFSQGGITREGMAQLRQELLRAGNVNRLTIPGTRADRLPVLPGGFAIMSAAMEALGLDQVTFCDGALRQGVLYDLIGRFSHQDLRDVTVETFMRRHEVDAAQAMRVANTACKLLVQAMPAAIDPDHIDRRFLVWAARLHELGLSIAHPSYHKHSAYILANADMPGFSRKDQTRLACLALGHRGKLERVLALQPSETDWLLILCLRVAFILHRTRDDADAPELLVTGSRKGFQVSARAEDLQNRPLTASMLEEEGIQWEACGMPVRLRVSRGRAGSRDA